MLVIGFERVVYIEALNPSPIDFNLVYIIGFIVFAFILILVLIFFLILVLLRFIVSSLACSTRIIIILIFFLIDTIVYLSN